MAARVKSRAGWEQTNLCLCSNSPASIAGLFHKGVDILRQPDREGRLDHAGTGMQCRNGQ